MIKSNENVHLSDGERLERIGECAMKYGEFLTAMGFDWKNDPNMVDTPMRVSKAYINELFEGCFTPAPKITDFDNISGYDGIVFQGKIDIKSTCSHHFLPFLGYAHVAYIPGHRNIGLSKLNRIVEWFARRPQSQEHLTMQIHDFLNEVCIANGGVAVMIEAKHTCASCRGVKHDSIMKTAKLSGAFKDHVATRNEFYEFIRTL